MTGLSLVADDLAMVLGVHTLIFPKELKRLNTMGGARSWVLLHFGDCLGGSHREVHKHWLTQHRESRSNWDLLEGIPSWWRVTERVNWGNGPLVVGGLVSGRDRVGGEGVRVSARWCLFSQVLSGVARVAVQAAVGTSALLSGFCDFWLQKVHSNGWCWVCAQCQIVLQAGKRYQCYQMELVKRCHYQVNYYRLF